MGYIALGRHLPPMVSRPLFGDRQLYGYAPDHEDASWQVWRRLDQAFYDQNQRRSVGAFVNDAGYRIMRRVLLQGLTVLEVGPGALDHLRYWRDKPEMFFAADIRPDFLARAERQLRLQHIPARAILVDERRSAALPLPDCSIDILLSFYSLEHLYPLEEYLTEFMRVLKPSGKLVGAIPCEGGLAWGMGRFLTTRRWLKAHGCAEPDKIISWEHPNFADGILNLLNASMQCEHMDFWPSFVPIIDVNLIARFIFRKC